MRLNDLKKRLRKLGVDGCLLFNLEPWCDMNVSYFTDVVANGFVFIGDDSRFVVSLLEVVHARRYSLLPVDVLSSFDKSVQRVVRGKVIGLNFDAVPLNLFDRLQQLLSCEFVDISPLLRELRMVKTDEELARLKKSARLASDIITTVIDEVNHKYSELDVVRRVHALMEDAHVQESFPTIVASGKHAASPHHIPSSSKLKGFVVIDMGVILDGYCSDITRTFFVGVPSKKDVDNYYRVLGAQQLARDKVNVSCAAVHDRVAAVLGKDFVHALGHGIGREVHEFPRLSASSKDSFVENMVFTLEPGIYPGNSGIRIEDMFVWKKGKAVALTTADQKLIIKK